MPLITHIPLHRELDVSQGIIIGLEDSPVHLIDTPPSSPSLDHEAKGAFGCSLEHPP